MDLSEERCLVVTGLAVWGAKTATTISVGKTRLARYFANILFFNFMHIAGC